MKIYRQLVLFLSITLLILSCGCQNTDYPNSETTSVFSSYDTTDSVESLEKPTANAFQETSISIDNIPEFTNQPFCVINDNIPSFDETDLSADSFEQYSPLDSLGRCGVAFANIGKDIMPTEERGSIGQIKPSGWKTVKYDNVDGKYLYNRCHLIGYQLTGENANEKNLITGTRYMNVEGMLPFENLVADYIKETKNHVLYRVTPLYRGNNLIASGVQMEAYSVEDKGDGVCFNVYVYNNQPGIIINYADGNSSPEYANTPDNNNGIYADYIINKNNKKFHYPTCNSVKQMKDSNKIEFSGSRDDLISQGYDPCGSCHP